MKDGSPHHHLIHAQTGRNKWCQCGCSSDMRFGGRHYIGILFVRTLWHPACFSPVGKQRVLRRMYGKDNRVLYSAKFSQGFKVAARRAWQVAGVSNGDTKIRVTGRGNPMAKSYRAGLTRGEIASYPLVPNCRKLPIEYHHRSFARRMPPLFLLVFFKGIPRQLYLKAKSSVKRCQVSRCHVSPPVTELKRPSSISSAKNKSVPIAGENQRFAMVGALVAIGNAVARTRVI